MDLVRPASIGERVHHMLAGAFRNATDVAEVEAAIRADAGAFAWHGKALTMIHELCDPNIFTWSQYLYEKREQ